MLKLEIKSFCILKKPKTSDDCMFTVMIVKLTRNKTQMTRIVVNYNSKFLKQYLCRTPGNNMTSVSRLLVACNVKCNVIVIFFTCSSTSNVHILHQLITVANILSAR